LTAKQAGDDVMEPMAPSSAPAPAPGRRLLRGGADITEFILKRESDKKDVRWLYGQLPNFAGVIWRLSLVAQIWKNYQLVISLEDAENLLASFASLYPTMIAHRSDYAVACQTRGAIVIGPDWREGRGRIVPLARLSDDRSPQTAAFAYPIQGLCGDIAMAALTAVDRRLLDDRIDGRLVGWIHDELIVETRETHVDRVQTLLQSEMERAFLSTFPTATLNKLIEVKVAANWAGIKEKPKAPAEEASCA
jgi:hypothetical protein